MCVESVRLRFYCKNFLVSAKFLLSESHDGVDTAVMFCNYHHVNDFQLSLDAYFSCGFEETESIKDKIILTFHR